MKAVILFLCSMATAAFAQVEGLPAPAEPRAMDFAKPLDQTLENGLRVIVVDRPGQPVITAALVVRSGAETDPAKLAGVAHFTAGLLQRGTTSRTATAIAQDLEELGAAIKCEATWDGTIAQVSMLAANAGPVFEILADVICHPKFAAEELDRLRKERIDEVQVAFEQPSQFARAAAIRAILGAAPYGHVTTGTPASLARIQHADVLAHYGQAFRPENSILIVAGDIRGDAAVTLAQKHFGSWKGAPVKSSPAPSTAEATEPSAILIDMPDAGQAAVYVGCPQPPRTDAPAYYTGQVANAVLGGGYSARLNREIRVKRGLSYGAGSRMSEWREAGLFGAACQTKNASAAEVVGVIREELAKLAQEAPSPAELTARRLVLTGSFQRELETNEGYMKRIADFVLHGLPSDAFASTLEAYNRVTAEQIREFAAAQLAPGQMSIVVVGSAKECEKPLREVLPKLRVISQKTIDFDSPTLTRGKAK